MKPKRVFGSKYRKAGGYTSNSFPIGVDPRLARVLSEAANCSLSKGTWQNYATAVKHIKKMNTEWGSGIASELSNDTKHGPIDAELREHIQLLWYHVKNGQPLMNNNKLY